MLENSPRTADATPTVQQNVAKPIFSFGDKGAVALAWQDLIDALLHARFWLAIGWDDIVQRYRGSILGPLWLTLTTAVFIAGLGPLYATLFGLKVREYLPFMATGIVCWNFIVATINESSRAFIDAGPVMREIKMPRMTHIFHVLWRNVIIFAHNLPVIVVVMIYAEAPIGLYTLAVIPGFALLCLNLLWIGVATAIVGARFRDVVQIISSLLMLAFFLTPVLWNPHMQRVPEWLINFNPFAAFIELVRAPILDQPLSLPLLANAALTAVVGSLVSAALFVRYRKYIVYWV
jgi:lipopolysaccharide transport system permease protein